MLSLVLAALLHLRLERAQRGKRRIGIERRLGWRRGGVQLGAWPLLALAAAAPIGPPAARLAPRRAGLGVILLRLVGGACTLLAAPLGRGLERATFAPWSPHLLPLPRLECPFGATLGAGRRLRRWRNARCW